MKIQVLLADDHTLVREGLKMILEAHREIEVVAEARDGWEAVRLARRLNPNVVVMDIGMPSLNGIEATREILETHPQISVVILSVHASREHVFRALQAGATGYVLKECAGEEVVRAVLAARRGRRYLSESVSDIMVEDYVRLAKEAPAKSPLERLSPRERQILQLTVEGKRPPEIASILHLSPKTVETYRSRIMEKLHLKDLPSLVKFAIQQGLTHVE